MITSTLPERIKRAREKVGITMAEAARRLGLSGIGYARYEYGDRTPSIQTLEVIARCFNTSVDYLAGKTEDMSPDYVIFTKDADPIMLEMASKIKTSDTETLTRLLAYYQELIKE